MLLRRGFVLCSLPGLVVLAGCASAGSASSSSPQLAAAPVIEAKPAGVWRSGAMVAAANPIAVDAGIEVLKAGGSAVDAAIAVQAVLGLVEPQSSGLGGGAFIVHYDAKTGDVITYDGREVAPQGATPDMFLRADGRPMGFIDAVRSGRSIGVPGAVAMLEMAHREHGRLPWGQSWRAAERLAEQGFTVSPRLNEMITAAVTRGGLPPEAATYLTTDGKTPRAVGSRLVNPRYASTVRLIVARGAAAFREGPLAEEIVAAARREPTPGTLSLKDLRAYRPNRLEPVCGVYRVYLVCGMRPPSSGGIAVLSVLGMVENFDLATMGNTTAGWHHFIEAQRLAYADRDTYVADDRYTHVPLAGLIEKDYLRSRARLIESSHAMAKVEPGNPPGATPRGRDATGNGTGTSHFVVVDGHGNVVSMTTTVEGLFGSRRMAGGFFLNNQLTDFSFRPVDDAGASIANAVAPGKKPRSSMSPTLVFRDGKFELAVGSPGGNSIIAYVSKAIIGMLDWNLSPQQAVELPNMIARGPIEAETSRVDLQMLETLAGMGHVFRRGRNQGEGSGLHAVRVMPDGRLAGAADPRREGKAVALY
ncbi:MAG: gamma-glutamyltransferase [Gammaproteobacteria bacterium]|nr:gamma-glutamyltransferase [Gammaproteobacteria bacterium]